MRARQRHSPPRRDDLIFFLRRIGPSLDPSHLVAEKSEETPYPARIYLIYPLGKRSLETGENAAVSRMMCRKKTEASFIIRNVWSAVRPLGDKKRTSAGYQAATVNWRVRQRAPVLSRHAARAAPAAAAHGRNAANRAAQHAQTRSHRSFCWLDAGIESQTRARDENSDFVSRRRPVDVSLRLAQFEEPSL